jgi:NCAIR mutase (PurE)-related protein
VGYEPVSAGGALLGMLNSCGSGVTVVNIDNGFASYAASQIIVWPRDELSIPDK